MKNIKALGINLGKNCVAFISNIMYFCLAIIGMFMWIAPILEKAQGAFYTLSNIASVVMAASALILVPFIVLAFFYENDDKNISEANGSVLLLASFGVNLFLGRRLYLTDVENYGVFKFLDNPVVVYGIAAVCFITAIWSIVEMYIMLIQGIKDVKTQND